MLRAPRYLFVCTGNIHRSPTAAVWADHYLTQRFVSGQIKSAGVSARPGSRAGALMTDAMRELGFDLREHRSQQVTVELLEWADRIVVMEPRHAEVLSERYGVPRDEITELWGFLDVATDEVADPIGADLEAHREAARSIGEAVKRLVAQDLTERRERARGRA